MSTNQTATQGDAALSATSLSGRLDELERRAARATKLVTWLAAIIALLLAVLITRLVPADDPRELVVRDAEGKPRIRSDLYGRDAVLEFLDEEGHVRAWIGY